MGDELMIRIKSLNSDAADKDAEKAADEVEYQFSRTFRLPFRAESDAVKAQCKNGILSVTVPRSADEKPKVVSITVE